MTPQELAQCMPFAGSRAVIFAEPLTKAMSEWLIYTAEDRAAFIAQIAHESGSFKFMRELADGAKYEGRSDLGNTEPGDGRRFHGRGPLQVTGRANYLRCGQVLGLDLISNPELLEQPGPGCRAAGWYWRSRGLSELAQRDEFGEITRRINGGYNGLDDRIKHWLRARKALGL